MVGLFTYKNEEDPIKNEGARVLTGYFFQTLNGSKYRSPWSNRPKFKLVGDSMVVLLTCKNEEDPI